MIYKEKLHKNAGIYLCTFTITNFDLVIQFRLIDFMQ